MREGEKGRGRHIKKNTFIKVIHIHHKKEQYTIKMLVNWK